MPYTNNLGHIPLDDFAQDLDLIDRAELEHPEDDSPMDNSYIASYNQKYGQGFINEDYYKRKEREVQERMNYNPDTISYDEYNMYKTNKLNELFSVPNPIIGGQPQYPQPNGFANYYNTPMMGQYANNPYQRNNYYQQPQQVMDYYYDPKYDNKYNNALAQARAMRINQNVDPGYFIDDSGDIIFKYESRDVEIAQVTPYVYTITHNVIQERESFFHDPVVIPSEEQVIAFKKSNFDNGIIKKNFVPKDRTEHMVYDYITRMDQSSVLQRLVKTACKASGKEVDENVLEYYTPCVVDMESLLPPKINPMEISTLSPKERNKQIQNARMVENAARIARTTHVIDPEVIYQNFVRHSAEVSKRYRAKYPHDMSLYDYLNSIGEEYMNIKIFSLRDKANDVRQLYDRNKFKEYILKSAKPNLNPKELAALGFNVEINPSLTLRKDGVMEVRAPKEFALLEEQRQKEEAAFRNRLAAFKGSYQHKLKRGDPTLEE